MSDEQMLEVCIESRDPTLIAEIEAALTQVNVKRPDTTRDLVTVLTIASSAVALVTALLDLRDRLQKKPVAPKVYVLNIDREQLIIDEATKATLTELIESSES